MIKSLLTVILFALCHVVVADATHRLSLAQWSVPRSAESVVAMPALSRAMQDFQATPGARLRVHHPGGEQGSLWAAELRTWLIALGVPSTDLEMRAGSANIDVIELEIIFDGQKTAPIMTILPDESEANNP